MAAFYSLRQGLLLAWAISGARLDRNRPVTVRQPASRGDGWLVANLAGRQADSSAGWCLASGVAGGAGMYRTMPKAGQSVGKGGRFGCESANEQGGLPSGPTLCGDLVQGFAVQVAVTGTHFPVMGLIYTQATPVSPVVSAVMQAVKAQQGERVDREVRRVSIGIDPLRDSASRLHGYHRSRQARSGRSWLTVSVQAASDSLKGLATGRSFSISCRRSWQASAAVSGRAFRVSPSGRLRRRGRSKSLRVINVVTRGT